jgi:ubiquinone/menaquinone biosynthesis C-methylase UbiE
MDLDQYKTIWPKSVPVLSPEQQQARERFMLGWHEILPKKYAYVEDFNHSWISKLPIKRNSKSLEVGAGIGEHFFWEDQNIQTYYQLDYREEFCKLIRDNTKSNLVFCDDIQSKTQFENSTFDRVLTVHVLEHLPNLPAALLEIIRILKDDGCFDVVIPCEGGLAYSIARKISAQRYFEKTFKMDYLPIVKSEHINTFPEIMAELKKYFKVEQSSFFPLKVPFYPINLCTAMRLTKIKI